MTLDLVHDGIELDATTAHAVRTALAHALDPGRPHRPARLRARLERAAAPHGPGWIRCTLVLWPEGPGSGRALCAGATGDDVTQAVGAAVACLAATRVRRRPARPPLPLAA
jgi:hypothetical protein